MNQPRPARLFLLLCTVLGTCLALAAAPAWGAQLDLHSPIGSFNGAGAPDGPMQIPFGMETDHSGGPSDGDVYAGNLAFNEEFGLTSNLFKFDESGGYAGVTLDGSNTPQGSFSFIAFENFTLAADGIAVDSSPSPNQGDLYVADVEHRVIHRFDEAGNYVCQITGTTTPSTTECNGLAGSQTPDGGFVPRGLAVDEATGTLYVSDTAHGVVDKFSPAGAYLGQIVDPHLANVGALALDSTGALYAVYGGFGEAGEDIAKFSPAETYVADLGNNAPTAVAVDTTTDHVFVGHFESPGIDEYDPAGNLLSTFPPEASSYPAVTVNPSTGRIYGGHFAFDGEGGVDSFSPETIVPDVSVEPPTAIGETTATLNGAIDPAGGGDVISCHFTYWSAGSSHQAPCSPAPPYASPTVVSADVSGLTPSTEYRFRLAAANAGFSPYAKGIQVQGEERTLSTIGPPTIEEQSASEVERYGAVLKAKINPRDFDTEFRFEFVDAEHFASQGGFASPATRSTALSQIGDGNKALAVAQNIGGLVVGTTYHFRTVAINARGTALGPDETFTTLPVVTIDRQWAYARVRSATAEAEIDSLGFAGSCTVEYVADSDFQASGYANSQAEPCTKGLGTEEATATADLAGLAIDTKYHFRFVATNASGSLTGEDKTFSTFGIESFDIELVDEEGNPETQAGSHPYEKIISYRFNHTFVADQNGMVPSLDAYIKDMITEQPPGLSGGRAEETPRCPGHLAEEQNCPSSTRVGSIEIEAINNGALETDTRALYEIVSPDGVASRYATVDPYTASDSKLRSSTDYGFTSNGHHLSEEVRAVSLTIHMWGVPADHNNSGFPRVATLRNPTACGNPLTARLRIDAWQAPGEFASETTQMPAITGCDKLEFHPAIKWQPTSPVAGSPTGLQVEIDQAQRITPDELAYADLKDVSIKPADGLIFNPAGANGLIGCPQEQFGYHQETPAECPDAAKIGQVEIVTPLVENPLRGGIYMATPYDNPFGSLFAIYLAVSEPKKGAVVKLAGEIQSDAGDGQLTAAFADNPQLPVESFKLSFFGGPLASLRTPVACGTYVTDSALTPWSAPQSGPPARPTDSYEITSAPNGHACVSKESDAPNELDFRAGTQKPVAGSYAPFVMVLRREDGTQQIADVKVTPPPGLLGNLAGLPRCPAAELAAAEGRDGNAERANPSCPAGSRVGTVMVAAGAGPRPYVADGKVYVAGPYKDAPASLAIVVPAVAGPFDLGTVVVRTPLRVDLETGQVAISSDPIPTILKGVSLDVRTIAVHLDRPGFTVNPTNCRPTRTTAGVTSLAGQFRLFGDPFQLGRCRKLDFAPKVRLSLLGKTSRRAHPGLRTVLTMPGGGANIAGVAVSMPPAEFLDNSHIRGVCTREQFNAGTCPADSVYGYAKAITPLLDRPLAGPVYMRSSDSRLPDLVADLNGEFRLALAGEIGSGNGGIQADIESLPDVPVSKFILTLPGGGRGLLQNSLDVCTHPQRATIKFRGQNGKVATLRPRLRAKCGRRR